MNYGLHIDSYIPCDKRGVTIPGATRKFTFNGSIPVALMAQREPTRADVLAQRVHNGVALYVPRFDSLEEALDAARKAGGTVCTRPDCACRKHYPLTQQVN